MYVVASTDTAVTEMFLKITISTLCELVYLCILTTQFYNI